MTVLDVIEETDRRQLYAAGAERTVSDLVLAARRGDRRAYEELVERHQRQVWAAVAASGSVRPTPVTRCR